MKTLIVAAIRCFLVLLVSVGAYALSAQLAAHGVKKDSQAEVFSSRSGAQQPPCRPWHTLILCDAYQTSGRR